MKQRGYVRTIRGDDGVNYQLPTGTYVMVNTNYSLKDATDRALAAANATGKASSLIVTDWTVARWILNAA
jgi:hypothetical protein